MPRRDPSLPSPARTAVPGLLAALLAVVLFSFPTGPVWAQRLLTAQTMQGGERVEIVTKEDPPRAGAIFFFRSREDLQRYHEARLPAIQEELISSFAEEHVAEEIDEVEDMWRGTRSRWRLCLEFSGSNVSA